jgi:hypothetical protein
MFDDDLDAIAKRLDSFTTRNDSGASDRADESSTGLRAV